MEQAARSGTVDRMMEIRTHPYRLLIVDDAPAVREALRWALEEAPDLEVVGEAGDGVEALERVTGLTPDMVILDVEMPRMDGYAVARTLKGMISPPVIIFLSVHADPASRQRAADAGGDAFVAKGSGWDTLVEQIRVERARAGDAST